MCFKRRPGLGHYNGTRADWRSAYRKARMLERKGLSMPVQVSALEWKAGLIVAFERKENNDPLTFPVLNRLVTFQLIEEISQR